MQDSFFSFMSLNPYKQESYLPFLPFTLKSTTALLKHYKFGSHSITEVVELKIKTTELLKNKILKKLLTLLTIVSHRVFVYFSPCS